ncbi:hypothetical protein N480_00060 [Pseudoalteromonas luteoviolacea S2607]|uniref:hypothetical protein n=1 Tax=Pseudoalteromonas luteoviolacea TaxID=43657 RepID=UPI0007B03B94|nr:hypothetical protein [Pseudoalteromonas luteoviolacea]KZN39253.1 hypothetical protein N480_00060 [Pseudoalteromonas luteoviolacea S2607]
MEIFSVIVAVSLTMFLFSSLSSMLVELINRRLNTRSRKLNDMLHTFYEEELKPYAKNEEQDAAEKFVRHIDKKDSKEQISTLDFMRSLAQTDIGYRIYTHIEKDAQYFFDDIAYRFEEFGERYSEYYRQHARKVNIWVSIFLAFAMNINLITIVDSLQYRNGVSEAFVQKAATIVNEQPDTSNKANFQSVLAEINNLKVPYGWPKQPFIDNQAKPFDLGAYVTAFIDSICMGVAQFGLGWLIWIVTTLITGMLIGLGSPFWFDVLKRLFSFSKVANLMFFANKNIAAENQPHQQAPQPWEVFERSIQAKEAQQSLLEKINSKSSADNT